MKNLMIQSILLMACGLFFSLGLFAQSTTNEGAQSGGTTNNPDYSASHGSFFGYQSGKETTTGGQNTFMGSQAGKFNTTGKQNTFIGSQNGVNNTTGSFNTFLGTNSGHKNLTGEYNVFNGNKSGWDNTTGNNNVFMGFVSGAANTSGSNNTYLGYSSGRSNTQGNNNVCLGLGAGHGNISGNNNVFLGHKAGYQELGSNKLYIENTDNDLNSNTNTLIYGDFATEQVAIATDNNYIPTGFTLAVGGKMIAEEVKVRLQGNWPDYVFAPEYVKPSLAELELCIEEEGHLPNMPSAAEVEAEGYMLGEMDVKLLEKIEELTLYLIDLDKEIKALQIENAGLQETIQTLGQ